jgi:hypothetical protein
LWQQKVKETSEAEFHGVQKSESPPKRDIVDTNPHASCAPGTIRTNNMTFLLYGSGLDEQKGRKHKKTNGRKINGFDYYCATDSNANGCKSSPCGNP